jgi:multidrug resistance efflux pump
MSVLGVPSPKVPTGPTVVPGPEKPRHTKYWVILAVVLVIAAGVVWKLRQQKVQRATEAVAAATRTATVQVGELRRTFRVAGVIQAERSAALMAPRLRGSRSGRGRGSSMVPATTSSGAAGTTSLSSSGSSSTGTSGTSGSTTGSAASTSILGNSGSTGTGSTSSSSADTTAGAAPGQTASSLGALRGTTNRFNDSGTASAKKASDVIGSRTAGSLAIPNADLGSTINNLPGGAPGSGSSGAAGDFSLILLHLAKAGFHVKKGDVVAEFDRQYQILRLDDYKASLSQLDANIEKLKADQAVAKDAHAQQVRSAKADLDKALLDLRTIEVRSAIESENFKLNVEEARAKYKQLQEEDRLLQISQKSELRAAEIDRDQARIEFQRAEVNVDKLLLKAPIDGIVVMQTIWRGGEFGQVREGDEVRSGQTFMTIVDPHSMVMNATVNQADSELLRLGMKANIRLDAYPEVTLPATVVGVGAMTKPGGWRPTYVREIPVRLRLDAEDERVLPDLTASASVVLATAQEATILPRESIFYEKEAHRPFVFLQSPSGWVRREVELGLVNHVAVSVRSGLQKGDVVATERPQGQL